jgi:hypothetical protein
MEVVSMVRERLSHGLPGLPLLILLILVSASTVWLLIAAARSDAETGGLPLWTIGMILLMGLEVLLMRGFFIVNPNEARVLQLFGHYVGSAKAIVTLDEERKAAMVSNLLVVLCGEKAAQPIVNTGTIHQ